ncbi:MAG: hypothetical protein OSJ58_13290 [Dysosmobacter sp.]|uniref:hypothetical protein n=1 Tax=uncultured Oscillibacter sp. TaxID=876091 RepID=UPI0026238B49|nr:hypothetical protein [uncultured Oscillibacter sp.]MCX4372772.1 hypothetical protein [Dysosmobacter sp.]
MSYVIKAVLSNPRHPECGQITIPFPIPADQYDQTIEMLQAMDLGYSVNRDCTVDEVDSHYRVLGALNGTLANVDQLDYLAKRLDSFCVGEDAQFQAMAHKMELADIKDFINLTFCCQQATVITNFSDLESIGRGHFLNLNGGSARTEELENLDGAETALLLIDSGGEAVTPYGVVYSNGIVLEELYNGHQFPAYLYDNPLMVLEITPNRGLAEGKNRNTCTSLLRNTKLSGHCSASMLIQRPTRVCVLTSMNCRKKWRTPWIWNSCPVMTFPALTGCARP